MSTLHGYLHIFGIPVNVELDYRSLNISHAKAIASFEEILIRH